MGKACQGLGIVAVVLSVLVAPFQVEAQEREEFAGILASTAGGGFSGLARIRIQIEAYTTDEERQRYIDILASEGWQELERAFLQVEKGRFIRVGQLGHNIAFVRSTRHATGRIIRLATARPIFFAEASRQSRSREHPFGLIELRLDNEGKGSGVVYAAASLEFNDDGALEIESYGNPPFSITEISVRD